MIKPRKMASLYHKFPLGLTCEEVVEVLRREANIELSVPALRKYVQQGVVSCSRRGKGDKPLGSKGRYPVSVLNQILRVRQNLENGISMEQTIACPVSQCRRRCEETGEALKTIEATVQQWAQAAASRGQKRILRSVGADIKAIKASLGSIEATVLAAQ